MSKRPNLYERLAREMLEEIVETFHLKIDPYNERRLLHFLENKIGSIRLDGVAEGVKERRLIEKEVSTQ